jgi:hypothetical protein
MSLPIIHVIDFEGDTSRGILEWGVATIKDGKIINFECDICSNIDDSEYDVLFGMSSGKFYCNPNFLDINVPNIDLKDAPKFDIEKMRDVFNSLSKNLDKL